MYEGIQAEIIHATRFDESSDVSTTYLGRTERANKNKLKAEKSFPISEQGYTLGKLLDGTECELLIDTGASKSFMSNHFTCAANHYIHYQICIKNRKNTSRKWPLCHHVIYYTGNCGCTWA